MYCGLVFHISQHSGVTCAGQDSEEARSIFVLLLREVIGCRWDEEARAPQSLSSATTRARFSPASSPIFLAQVLSTLLALKF